MSWMFVALAEIWRWRWKIVLPTLVCAGLGVVHVVVTPPMYQARTLLQLQSEQAREPLLQKITAKGHQDALYQKLISANVLQDSGREVGIDIEPGDVELTVFNDHFLGVSYRSHRRLKMEETVDSIAFNFIQEVLAPERQRVEQMLSEVTEQHSDLMNELATPVGNTETNEAVAERDLRKRQLESEMMQLQTDLRLVNTAFDRNGSQALLWFAEAGRLIPPPPFLVRLLGSIIWFGALGALLGSMLFWLPERWNKGLATAKGFKEATGLPLLGTLPYLGKLNISPAGVQVLLGGRWLRPSGFGEAGRLHDTLVKGLRKPLAVVGVEGDEGVSTLALLLAERAAIGGKTVALVDLNLKNHTLTRLLKVRGEAWTMPEEAAKAAPAKSKKAGKGRKEAKKATKVDDVSWGALQPMPGLQGLKILPAPRHPRTLQALGVPGGVNRLMDALHSEVDVVIVDTTPLGATNRGNVDALAVAGACGRAVLVGATGVNTADDVRTAADGLLLGGAPLVGVVVNEQYNPSRRQLLLQIAAKVETVLPKVGTWLRRGAAHVKEA